MLTPPRCVYVFHACQTYPCVTTLRFAEAFAATELNRPTNVIFPVCFARSLKPAAQFILLRLSMSEFVCFEKKRCLQ